MKKEGVKIYDSISYDILLKQAFRKNPERINEKNKYLNKY
jgi:hypothetical protein